LPALVLAWLGLETILQLSGLAARWIYRPRLAHPGAPTILCLGDSHTFGVGVPADQAYPAQLGRLLQDQGVEVNVVNLGVPGQNTSQIRRNLPGWIRQYHPVAVVILAGVNDGWNQADALLAELEDGQLRNQPWPRWPARVLSGLSGLKTYRLIAYLFRRAERDRRDIEQARDRTGQLVLHDYDPANAPQEPYGDARRAYRNLCRIADLALNQKVTPVFLTYIGLPPVTFEVANQLLRDAARSRNSPLVDNDRILRPELMDKAGLINTALRDRLLFPDMHLTEDGYRRIAANVAQVLLERGLIPKAGAKLEKP